MPNTFNAFVIRQTANQFTEDWEEIPLHELPTNELLIRVEYSSLNYKDALSASGNKGVTRHFPHVPGIDAAGTIVQSTNLELPVNTKVLITGFDLGMNTWGGFGEYISVPAGWVLKMPAVATPKMAMGMGTAGLTAALSINRLVQAGIVPESGPIAVSGATGGVGSIAVSILAKLGYQVTAISGKVTDNFVTNILGASRVIDRTEFASIHDNKAMNKPEFAAAIDTVGGAILSGLLKSTQYGGLVTCCGMVSSADLHTSIFPFILRGIDLAGIDSVAIPLSRRQLIWEKLLTFWYPENTEKFITEIAPQQLSTKLSEILAGQAKGRFVLKHGADTAP